MIERNLETQAAWTISQAVRFTGISRTQINRIIDEGRLKKGKDYKDHGMGEKYRHILITRDGMYKLTGFRAPAVDVSMIAREAAREAIRLTRTEGGAQ